MASSKWLVASGLILLIWQVFAAPASSVEKQLKSQSDSLKKIQEQMKKAETKVKELENKESGVLKTIAEIDNGLISTREYLTELQKKENTLNSAIIGIEKEIDISQKNIDLQQTAIKARIRNLYIHGKQEEWELLFNLLKENENPKRKIYWVQRLLENDKAIVENYLASLNKLQEKKQQLGAKQKELANLHENKAKEERKLQNQLIFQNDILTRVQKDKSTQEKAIAEHKRNQQALALLIAALAAKKKAETAKAPSPQKAKAAAETPIAVGPKCTPLNGQIISDYGYHINRELNIKLEHKGTEIRGQKGEAVRAAAAGIVAMVGNVPGHGPSVILDHKGAYYSVYGHLGGIKVKEGEVVQNCQEIGTVGNAESTNGYKLFFQIYKGMQTQDPIIWLKK